MKNVVFLLCFILSTLYINAQVGIGTNDPKSLLDIEASNASNPSPTDGLIIPSVTAFPAVNPGPDQDGMLVFLKNNISGFRKGHYYWDNSVTRWKSYGGEWRDGYDTDTDDLVYANQASMDGLDVVFFDDGSGGMGTENPVENLEIKLPGANPGIQVTSSTHPNAPNIIFYTKNGTLASGDFLNNEDPIGGITASAYNGTAQSDDLAALYFKADGDHSSGNLPTKYDFSVTRAGDDSANDSGVQMTIKNNGNVGIGVANPTASLHLRATAGLGSNNSPIKLSAGTNLVTPESGVMEYDGNQLYFTPNSSRKLVLSTVGITQGINFPNIAPGQTQRQTISITGADATSTCSCNPVGFIEVGLVWSCFIDTANNAVIQISNNSGSPINPGFRTWKVKIIK